MRKIIRGFLFLIVATPIAYAQLNLVPNPDFALNDSCPNDFSQINKAKFWIAPTAGTSDYFNSCCPFGPLYVGVPQNAIGFQNGIWDSAYVGLIAREIGSVNYREYLQTQLTAPLVINQRYFVAFYVSLANNSKYATDDLGILFSRFPISSPTNMELNMAPQIQNPSGAVLNDTLNWMKIAGSFVADSVYQYITIGNFNNDNNTDTTGVYPTNISTDIYYHIDHVCVSTDSLTCNNVIGIKTNIYSNSIIYNYVHKKLTLTQGGIYKFRLVDITGIIKMEREFEGTQEVSLQNLEPGCYILHVTNSEYSYSKKIIINN